ncbi:histidinol-phosphate transaminase [Dyella monticola]|uniref:Histidinol-phosphate aminotransferase n=1 Tax=Dyella monticola TaxID=1927958 RepID=A0A370X673_9GAMM|nr:histidinol-phosphate transaminase [Dyella monticola]RDS83856.1 histidinol-phosphate transaminase [Dyella monticola]
MSVLDLARPEIRTLQPYSSARMEAGGGQIMLNANESAWQPIGEAGAGCNRYPDPQPERLLCALASLYGVKREQLFVGRGSDEAIDLLVRAFCRAGQDAIVVQPPTFGMYAVSARIQNAAVIEAPLATDFSLDVSALLAAVAPSVKLVFLCTPNNPSGKAISGADIEQVARALAGRALVVVDEAYIEFADQPSVIDMIDGYEHVAILRTLSKAWALAGARIGSLIASADVIALIRRIMPPYPLPSPCVAAALEALSPSGQDAAREHITVVREQRTIMRRVLPQLSCVREVLPSEANFLAVRFADAGDVYQRLLHAGIVVRDIRRYPGLGDALRITIGTPDENARVLAVLNEAMSNKERA